LIVKSCFIFHPSAVKNCLFQTKEDSLIANIAITLSVITNHSLIANIAITLSVITNQGTPDERCRGLGREHDGPISRNNIKQADILEIKSCLSVSCET
jgi:hypothetical protein